MTKLNFLICLLLCCYHLINAQDSLSVDRSQAPFVDQIDNYELRLNKQDFLLKVDDLAEGLLSFEINGRPVQFNLSKGAVSIGQNEFVNGLNFISIQGKHQLYHFKLDSNKTVIKRIPLWYSILPPLIAIMLALVFKEVIISLFVGIWAGAFIAGGMEWYSLFGVFKSIFAVVEKYIIAALIDGGHLSVIVFSLLIGGMVALISKNGGMMGVVESLSKYAKTRVSTQITTWFLGIAIFFDDYANTLIVGNTMRSVTDKFRISREKLAYIVDSTAAPVSAIAFITTWIGAELGYIGDGLVKLGFEDSLSPYSVFLDSLKYSFYPILTLLFVFMLIRSGKDFSNMYKAEERAIIKGQVSPARSEDEDEPDMEDLSPVSNAPRKWWHAALPIATVIVVTVLGLLNTGLESIRSEIADLTGNAPLAYWVNTWNEMGSIYQEDLGFFGKLGRVIGASDSYVALLWASTSGVLMALIITLGSRTMKLIDAMHWLSTGIKTMIPAIIILILAWALAITTSELHTAEFITNALKDSIHPFVIPGVIFIISAAIAFSTGSSWSTMAILYPIAIPASYAICQASNCSPELSMEILLCVISTVLSASVLGDHISPISDTTILSSLASDCNHIDHVKTQIPYALVVGLFSLVFMSLSIILGGGWFVSIICMIIAVIGLYFVIKIFGKELPKFEAR